MSSFLPIFEDGLWFLDELTLADILKDDNTSNGNLGDTNTIK